MKTTLGVIVANRGFFPDHLADDGRKQILALLEAEGIKAITLSPDDTPFGTTETYEDSKKCAALFKEHREEIDGILITHPNFGEERGAVDAIRLSGLDVPVLVQAFPDKPNKMSIENRRDSFCGKISMCNNLLQYRIPFSLTRSHTVDPLSTEFKEDLHWFAAVCRVVKGMRNIRIGAIGARPAAFNTVRFSEKLLEQANISVEPIDLSEIFGRTERLKSNDPKVIEKVKCIKAYITTNGISEEALIRMAKFGLIVDEWIKEKELVGTAIQCWTSMEEFFGVVPCTIMSMMSNNLVPSACEVDIPGLLGMYALQLASGRPSALLDWNNNYDDDPDKTVLFHCSNLPMEMFNEAHMDYQAIIAGSVGKENTYGTVAGRIKAAPFTFARVSTSDDTGMITAYTGEGEFTDDPLETFGGYGIAKIPELQELMKHICYNGFEHHVAVNLSRTSRVIEEAFDAYLGWDVYNHNEGY
jgi:L-fucose isomerase-like protein